MCQFVILRYTFWVMHKNYAERVSIAILYTTPSPTSIDLSIAQQTFAWNLIAKPHRCDKSTGMEKNVLYLNK